MELYDFKARAATGEEISLDRYRGKVLLIVNTATGCGFTPQYDGLEKLYASYRDAGFEILDFPCNQFGHQAPGTEEEIVSFCRLRFGVSFRQFAKIEVNGKGAHPLYVYLKKARKGLFGCAIKWNFTKFLVDKEGNVVKRYAPTVKPEAIENDIKELL